MSLKERINHIKPCPLSFHTFHLFTLQYLFECQFDDNLKFKMAINEEEPEKMRLQPIGRDQQGLMYWLQLDQEQNIRLYTEEQDDLDGSTWKCIVRYCCSGGYMPLLVCRRLRSYLVLLLFSVYKKVLYNVDLIFLEK